MMKEEEYYTLLAKIIGRSGRDILPMLLDYEEFMAVWEDFEKTSRDKIIQDDPESVQVKMGTIFSLRWGVACLGLGNEDILFHSLFLALSNSAFAIIKLAREGLDYQANVLLRNLCELCFTLLNIIIDPEKREALFKSGADENEYEVWRRHFSFGQLNATLQDFDKKMLGQDHAYWHKWRQRLYSRFSSAAHNDFAAFLVLGRCHTKTPDDIMEVNLWGNMVTRADKILYDMNSILWYTEKMFLYLLSSRFQGFDTEALMKGVEDKTMWSISVFLGMLGEHCYAKVRKEEGESGEIQDLPMP